MYYVYILENTKEKTLYIGYTSDLRRRVANHNSGKGGKTTKRKAGWSLIYYEAYLNKQDALGREKFLKGGSGRKYINKQLVYYLERNKRQ